MVRPPLLGGTKGVAMVNNPGTPNNTMTYNPNGKFESLGVGKTAMDVFRYVVQDADGYTSIGTVSVTIQGQNDLPVAVNDTNISVPRNGTVAISVLNNDRDPDGDTLLVIGTGSLNTKGTATLSAGRTTVTYDPERHSSTTC